MKHIILKILIWIEEKLSKLVVFLCDNSVKRFSFVDYECPDCGNYQIVQETNVPSSECCVCRSKTSFRGVEDVSIKIGNNFYQLRLTAKERWLFWNKSQSE